jgi:hypothetical protein
MLNVLKSYDTTTAEGLLARTSFYLEENPVLSTLGKLENEDFLRSDIIKEICANLKIDSAADNKQMILDYIDTELEKSMMLDEDVEKDILIKLSNEARLPTDLYNIKILNNMKKIYQNVNVELARLKETIRTPDMVCNFNDNSGYDIQKDISIFVKIYKDKYSFNDFYLIVIGRRQGLDFIIDQAWRLYNDFVLNRAFDNALDLLKIFVNEFGVEVEFQGTTSKFFLSVIAESEKEFEMKIDKDKLVKNKGKQSFFTTFYFAENISQNDKKYSLFFAIDLNKYRNYLKVYQRSVL